MKAPAQFEHGKPIPLCELAHPDRVALSDHDGAFCVPSEVGIREMCCTFGCGFRGGIQFPWPRPSCMFATMFGYLRLQLHFLVVALREFFRRPQTPVPSPRLRHRVHGSTDVRGYLEVGQRSWRSIESLLRQVGRDPDSLTSILDFGCGSGRVVRAIPKGPGTASSGRKISAADIDASAIRWCSANIPGVFFQTIAPTPPTPFADQSFDLIFAVSVFTHFDEAMQFSWLAELRRLLKPGGLLIASVHGDYHRSLNRRTFDLSHGFAFTQLRTGRFKKDGLPDFYQDAQHTRAYIEREWTKHLELVHFEERGIAEHHDAVVLRRS